MSNWFFIWPVSKIHFFIEDISFKVPQSRQLKTWILEVIHQCHHQPGEINYIFCSDAYLHRINLEYLAHDTLTDIVTFDNAEEDNLVEGDIFISIERVRENALHLNIAFETELQRVMIHGILHLMGLKDKTKKEVEEMRRKEEECLMLLHRSSGFSLKDES